MDTIERAPAAHFYMESGEKRCRSAKRPSIFDLLNGVDTNRIAAAAAENGRPAAKRSLSGLSARDPAAAARKFGWIEGVFLRCVLNIFGVILYIRVSWVTGQAGVLMGQGVVLLATVVTTITALSTCAICTNGEVKGGGAYFLISRSLGPEFGGSIGLIFCLANCVGAAMYVVGFAETLRDWLKEHGVSLVDGEVNDVRLIGLLTCTILLCIIMVGTGFESKLQMVLLLVMGVSLVDYFVGTVMPPSEAQRVRGVTGYSWRTLRENLLPGFRDGHTFFSVFAIYFPAATGIMAGANISGDLRRPQRAIPLGTLAAVLLTTLLYLALVLCTGASVLRDADGLHAPPLMSAWEAGRAGFLFNPQAWASYARPDCALNGTCPYGLRNYFQVVELTSFYGPLITAGIFASSLSSALLSMVSAPKVFQAVCQDRIFPYIGCFARGSAKDGEPRRAYLLGYALAMCVVVVGDLNTIAPIISNFFLCSYTLINYACFDSSFAKSPGFRPAFKYYNMWVSLVGAIMCITVMFIVSWFTALLTFLFFGLLFMYIKRRKPEVNWGSSTQAHCYRNALSGVTKLEQTDEHVKNYRPQLLVFSGQPARRPWLVEFSSNIAKDKSLMVCADIVSGAASTDAVGTAALREAGDAVRVWLKRRKIKAFYTAVQDEDLRRGAQQLMQTVGLGRLRPNVVVLGFKEDWLREGRAALPGMRRYYNVVQDSFDAKLGVTILRHNHAQSGAEAAAEAAAEEEGVRQLSALRLAAAPDFRARVRKGRLDVWWLYDDGGLSLLLPYLLTLPRSYLESARLRLFAVAFSGGARVEQQGMIALMKRFRIRCDDIVVFTDVALELRSHTSDKFDETIAPFGGTEEGLISEDELAEHRSRTLRHLRTSELIKGNSADADLIIL